MGKDKCHVVRLMRDLCPSAFETLDESDCVQNSAVVLDDAMLRLRNFGHAAGKRYGFDTMLSIQTLFEHVFLPVKQAFSQPADDRATRVYVMLFDKASAVTSAKQPEQAKRDLQVVVGATPVNLKVSYHAGAPAVTESARDWQRAINDRGSRQTVIRVLCEYAKANIADFLEDAGALDGWAVVLDYETQRGLYSIELVQSLIRPPLPQTATEEFKNSLGEFDVAFLQYLYSPAIGSVVLEARPGSGRVLVQSTDSDIVSVAMLNLTPGRCGLDVRIRTSVEGVLTLVDPQLLVCWAQEVLQLEDTQAAAYALVESYILSGTDFVAHGAISNRNFVQGYLQACAQKQLSPAEYFERVMASDLAVPTASGLSGCKRASKSAIAERRRINTTETLKRSKWNLAYWAHSVFENHKMPVDPQGHGWSQKFSRNANGKRTVQIVRTEELEELAAGGVSPSSAFKKSK